MSHSAGPAGDGDVSPRRSNSPLGPQITPIYVTDERGDRGKRNPLAAAVKLPASSRCTPVAGVTLHRARGSWVDLADGDKKPRNLPKDSPVEGVFRARKQASPRAWGGYDEFANTVELMILVLSTVMGAAFFGLGFYVLGVDNVLFKALFAFYCLMIPLRLLADVLNRVTATKELRILGPINT